MPDTCLAAGRPMETPPTGHRLYTSHNFLSNMKLSDLVTDGRSGKISPSKFWFNIGNTAMTYAFTVDAWRGGLTDMKLLAYGAIVAGSGMASKWISKKYDSSSGINN